MNNNNKMKMINNNKILLIKDNIPLSQIVIDNFLLKVKIL